MIDISSLSSHYEIRRLDDSDADSILSLCRDNPQYYQYAAEKPTREQVLHDLHITPPGIGLSDKYFIGFFQEKTLIAVMDLIDGYPKPDTAFIGFFMMNKAFQGQGIGTAIIQEAAAYLKPAGKRAIRLMIYQKNPQATHFWKKNGFLVIGQFDRNGRTILIAEKTL